VELPGNVSIVDSCNVAIVDSGNVSIVDSCNVSIVDSGNVSIVDTHTVWNSVFCQYLLFPSYFSQNIFN
jgi:nicotinamide riboside kinase